MDAETPDATSQGKGSRYRVVIATWPAKLPGSEDPKGPYRLPAHETVK
jgi:hypothetical protein